MASNDDYDKEGMLVRRSYRVPEYARPDYDPTSSEAIRKYLGERVSAPSASPAGRWWQRHGILPEILRGDAPRTVSSEEEAFRNRVLADQLAIAEQRKSAQQNYQRLAETSAELRNMPRVTGSTYFEPLSDEELARRQQEDVARAQAIINSKYPVAPTENSTAPAGSSTPVSAALRSVLRQQLNIPAANLEENATTVPASEPTTETVSSPTLTPILAPQNPYAIAGYEPSDQNVSSPISPPAAVSAGSSTASARPSTPATAPAVRRELTDLTSGARSAPTQGSSPSFSLSRFFGGPEYQSTGDRVVKESGQGVNFGSGENAADFFRADRELRKQRPEMFERQAEARGGAPKPVSGGGGKDAALHKALEIIHHLLVRGR